jgi:polyribonucleotide nucleotidyltransferase
MDLKVAGSSKGVTAIQMDIKIQGISFEIMEKALAQANEGRMHILGVMNEAISQSREDISEHAPMLLFTQINPEKIGSLIGPGGKMIQAIQKDYEVDIFVEDDGKVTISGTNNEKAKEAREFIRNLVAEPEIGKVYNGKVIKIMDFGAFVEILPKQEGLLHISQIDNKRVNKVTDVLKEGDEVKVKLIKIENGKFSLSRKVLLNEGEGKKEE